MNFFCDSGGNIFHVDPEKVYQGSANANTIYFIGAFASSCSVTVAFGLPNGVYTEPTLLTLVTDSETLSVNDKNGVKFNVWQVRLNGVVTENYGKVYLQFYVYGNGGNGQGACIASAGSSFEVSKGVPITLPDDTNYPEESLLAQILAQLQRLQAQAAASTEAIEENTEAIVEVQKALENKIDKPKDVSATARLVGIAPNSEKTQMFTLDENPSDSVPVRSGGGVLYANAGTADTALVNNKQLNERLKTLNGEVDSADARLQAEANGEVTIATIEINNPNTTLAFKNLEGMTEIDWGDGTINSELTHTYENLGVYYCRIYGLVSIGEEAFVGSIPNRTPITHIKISNKVTSIGDNAFTFTRLRSIEIPNSVTYIGSSFDQSHYLEKIVIPESVTYIDVDAFNMCSNLKIVELKGAPPQQIYSGDIFSFANKLEKIIVPYGMVEAYKSAPMWSDYATLIDCLVYQSDLDISEEKITEKITENREEINKDIKNLYAITAQGGLYTMLEVEQAFVSRETADGESIVDGQYTAPTKIQGSTVKCKNLFDISKIPNSKYLRNDNGVITIELPSEGGTSITTAARLETVCPSLKVGDIVTLSFQQTNEGGTTTTKNYIHLYEAGITWTSNTSKTITQEMLDSKIFLYTAYYPQTYKRSVSSEFQIEYGSIATEYQPYFTGLKNAYFKGIKSTGKNLFDISKIPNVDGLVNNGDGTLTVTNLAYTGMSLRDLCPVLKVGDIIAFSITGADPYGIAVGTYIWLNGESKTITEDMLNGEIVFPFAANISNIQIEYGTTATAYEPYKEDIYEFPEAVELAFGDTLDVKNRKIINNGHTEVINIADKACATAAAGWRREGFFSFYAISALPKTGKCGAPDRITAICTNGFSQGSWEFSANTFENGTERYILTGNGNNTLYVIMPNSDLGVTQEDTDEVKIAAAKEWFANNSVTVRYKTVDTTETSIETPERYQAWKNGSETVVQGDTDNSEYGAVPTVTTEYFKLTEV